MTDNCPVCKNAGFTILYDRSSLQGASIVQCRHCGHLYTLLASAIDTEALYNDEVYQVVENRRSIFDKILGWEYGRVIKKINRIKTSKGSLLDFGCGKGKFAHLAVENGWKAKGVETAMARAAYATNVYGLDVDSRVYSNGKIFDQEFDVLTLFHVLEHLPDPPGLLNRLTKSNLSKNGLLVIEVPNIRSLQAKIAGSHWIHLDIPRHISHFTPAQLEKVAGSSGFVSLQTSFFSFHLGVLGMTDSLMKRLGYRRNIIYQLKKGKNKALLAAVLLVLPFAFGLELIAAGLRRGGVTRKYFIPKGQS